MSLEIRGFFFFWKTKNVCTAYTLIPLHQGMESTDKKPTTRFSTEDAAVIDRAAERLAELLVLQLDSERSFIKFKNIENPTI